jgi:xanthine dehydrogenase accessory factor
MSWIADLHRLSGQRQACVLVTLNLISGSAPRESGSRMIVTAEGAFGSIGGGNLEFMASRHARNLLGESPDGYQEHELYGLGPALNQCCGGAVALLYEVFSGTVPAWLEPLHESLKRGEAAVLMSRVDLNRSSKAVFRSDGPSDAAVPEKVLAAAGNRLQRPDHDRKNQVEETKTGDSTWWVERLRAHRRPLMLFGAGHVGQEVARALTPLPFRVSWVDSRAGIFPAGLPGHVTAVNSDKPERLVAQAPPSCIFIVMTHSHQLDEDICFEVLQRKDFSWLGLIGSATKRRRFVHRLAQRGVSSSSLHSLVCPIGLSSIRGKQPATIALSLAAQLMTEDDEK